MARRPSPELAAFDTAVSKIVSETFDSTLPATLFHYTTQHAAECIIRSKQFRFTRHDCTNDKDELRCADETALAVARALVTEVAQLTTKEILRRFVRGLESGDLKVTNVTLQYLACFSDSPDLANQWHVYGDGGLGVCLGLTVIEEPYPGSETHSRFLSAVDYSETSWREKIRSSFIKICNRFASEIRYAYGGWNRDLLAPEVAGMVLSPHYS